MCARDRERRNGNDEGLSDQQHRQSHAFDIAGVGETAGTLFVSGVNGTCAGQIGFAVDGGVSGEFSVR